VSDESLAYRILNRNELAVKQAIVNARLSLWETLRRFYTHCISALFVS